MRIYIEPDRMLWKDLVRRPGRDDSSLETRVSGILEQVRNGGDQALTRIIRDIEGAVPDSLKVPSEEIEAAASLVPEGLRKAIEEAAERIGAFHQLEIPSDTVWDDGAGAVCRRRFLPLRRAGFYIPGGTAPLFSTVLMLGVPSKIAGCRERIICTPPGKDGKIAPPILYAASLCGIKDIFKVGGAQAIAAMAYGTRTIGKVDKIFGPGNRYVTKAKQFASKEGIAIDMPAGPSEVMVIMDESARVPFVAADLLSQAEHGPDSQVILVCGNVSAARQVMEEMEIQGKKLARKDIVKSALAESRMIVFKDLDDRIDFANQYAPEHLILAVANPEEAALKIEAAGSVFLGHYSPESAGDYASGTNHILPTGGTATAWSGVGVESFMRAITFQSLDEKAILSLGPTIIEMAEAESLEAHANAVRVRIEEIKEQ